MLLADINDLLEQNIGRIRAAVLAVPMDVTRGADVAGMVTLTLDRFGWVDVLLADAGICIPGQLVDGDPEAWTNLLSINVDDLLCCIHTMLPHMTAQKSGNIL